MAFGLLALLALQSLGSRALHVCLCDPVPLLAGAADDCCSGAGGCDPERREAPAASADDCGCVVIALGIDDAVLQAAPVVALAATSSRWSELLVPTPPSSSPTVTVRPRPPPRPDPALTHLATVRLTI